MSFIVKSKLLGRIPLLGSQCVHGEDNLILKQLVRWRTRRWAPKSYKSVAYVRQRTVTDPVELQKTREKYNIYKTQMRALSKFMIEMVQEKEKAIYSEETLDREEKRIDYLMNKNDQWNEETAELRLERTEKDRLQEQEEQNENLLQLEQQEEERLEKANLFIQQQKEITKTFVREDQLDLAIEEALNTRKIYNFIIDKEGLVQQERSDGSLAKDSLEEQIRRLKDQMQENSSIENDVKQI